MRVLITGVSGFIGPHLARQLQERGGEVSGTYFGPPPELPGVEVAEVDLDRGDELPAWVERNDPEVVVHLAGLSHVGSSWQQVAEHFRINFLGTERVLAAAAGRRFLLASSAEVYGAVPADQQPISESRAPAPCNPYGMGKAAAERLVLAAGGVVVRSFNVIGPGQSPLFALPAFARQLAAIARGDRPPVLQVGNLEPRRDFVPVSDAVAGLALLATEGEPGEAYNLASGEATSIGEALRLLQRVAGVEARIEVDESRLRPAEIALSCGDPRKLEALGWRRRKTLADALTELWHEVAAEL